MINTSILESIESQTAQILPEKEAEWWEERKRIEEYELEYRRAVFRVENRQRLLLQALMDGSLPVEAGRGKIEVLVYIYSISDEAYLSLIMRYVAEAAALAPEPLAQHIQQSQQTWSDYRQHMNTVWEGLHSRIEQARWMVRSVKNRLEEVFGIFQELKSG